MTPPEPVRGQGARAGHVLVVDLGTTAVKVGLATLTGQVLWHAEHELQTVLLPEGGAEQDARRWWELVTRLSTAALRSGACDPATVRAVAVTGQWASTVPTAADGEPVAPCMLWMDSRGGGEARRRMGGPVAGYAPLKLLRWVRRSGGAPSLDGADPLGHRWYLRAQRPESYAAARWLLEPVDYLTLRLTGRASATPASMTASWLTDNRDLSTAGYDRRLVAAAGLEAAKLPPLLPNGSVVGRVLPRSPPGSGCPRRPSWSPGYPTRTPSPSAPERWPTSPPTCRWGPPHGCPATCRSRRPT